MFELIGLGLAVQASVAVTARGGAKEVVVKAAAAGLPDGKRQASAGAARRKGSPVRTRLYADRIGYSAGKGFRRVAGADYGRDFGSTSLTVSALQGERNHGRGKASHSGVQLAASVGREWTGALATTTSLSVASDSPVFGRLQAGQDVLVRVGAGTRVQVGGRYARFHDGRAMLGGVAGISSKVGPMQLSYRLSAFAPDGERRRSAHLVTVQLGDRKGKGKSELSVGAGDSLHELVWDPAGVSGRYRTANLKRSQPMTKELGLSLTVGHTWYERPQGNYQGTKFGLSIDYKR